MNLIKADLVLSTTPSLDVFQWKRSKGVKYYVHLPHMANDITTYKMFGLDFYDAVLLSGQYQIDEIRRLEQLRGLPAKDLNLAGIPYMDKMLERLNGAEAKSADKKDPVVLLAPSWGNNGILTAYGAPFIENLIKTGYRIIIRPHPQSFKVETEIIDEIRKEKSSHENLYLDEDPDNFRALSTADLLISDFSSITFDFMFCFGKPVILTNTEYDLSPYDAYWSKKEHWLTKTVGELGYRIDVDKLSEIGELVDRLLKDEEKKRLREEYKKRLWTNQGSSAAAIADYLTSGKRV
jgi:CDP-glycerol glycerophosphotransferase (TagB/SpsB family)